MILEITQEDIDKGKRCNPYECPISQALKRITGCNAYVGFEETSWGSNVVKNSQVIQRFIDRFDRRRPVKPSRFRLKEIK